MGGRTSILIVEDERDLSELIRINLEREGFACRCAADGRQAVESLRRDPPDLVILDRMLPGVSGDEVLRRIRSNAKTAALPVLMLTA
ncbi:MAG: response regulator, partial [Planctomycetota bacterium]